MTRTQRATAALKAVTDEVKKPLPKWVGVAGAVLVAVGVLGHDLLVTAFGGGRVGNVIAAWVPLLGAVLSTLSVSLNGKGE